jgi:hypothetical protein
MPCLVWNVWLGGVGFFPDFIAVITQKKDAVFI